MRDYEYLAMKIRFRNRITLLLMCTALAASCAAPNLSYIAGKNEQRAEILAATNQFYDAAGIYNQLMYLNFFQILKLWSHPYPHLRHLAHQIQ